jgi:hypothetical protein
MKPDLYQTGTEPEFWVTEIAKVEPACAGAMRLYCASSREGSIRLEYTVVIPMEGLSHMARQLLHATSCCFAMDNLSIQ